MQMLHIIIDFHFCYYCISMNKSDGLGNFVINEDEIVGTSFDIFNLPMKESNTLWGKEIEIRLLTVLDR